MKLTKIFTLFVLVLGSLAYADKGSDIKETPISEMPFKKSLTLTSVLLWQDPIKDNEFVANLMSKMTEYAVLESQAEEVVAPLKQTRKALKQTVSSITFKNEKDIDRVTQQLQKDTDALTAHNLEELKRDKLIQCSEDADPVLGSALYEAILNVARPYQKQQEILQKHSLFKRIEEARKELKPLMYKFLKDNFTSVQQLQKEFNVPVKQVNEYLDALPK